jgi:4'-phosphopantetheinyl transferase
MITLWKTPQSEPVLGEKDIHVWRAELDLPTIGLQNLHETLSIDERTRAERFHFEKDRRRYIVEHGILRAILSSYLSIEPSLVQFWYGQYGKPELANPFVNARIHFNMSDSQGLALFAFTRDHEIGVDIEQVRNIPEMDQIAEQFFSPEETAIFRSLPESAKKEAFYNCWTHKEAFLKARGQGLGLGLNQCEVSLAPGEPAALLRITDDPQEAACWVLQELNPGSGFIAALAVRRHDGHLECFPWQEQSHIGVKENDSHYPKSYCSERPYWKRHTIPRKDGKRVY